MVDTPTLATEIPGLDTALAQFESTSSPKACLFRKFPPEIREIIFKEAIEWDGKMPGLIVALRGARGTLQIERVHNVEQE
jgi:hypothetical protein